MSDAAVDPPRNRWRAAWPDAVACAIGLGVAWHYQWRTTDLVWSLWLSSLVVGYASIVQTTWRTSSGLAVVGTLAFFTFHFGMFHFVHSCFLNFFFPVVGSREEFPTVATYAAVVWRYSMFLPAAFLAERAAFAKGARASDFDFIRPYLNVFRMHGLIFAFVLAYFLNVNGFAVYAVVYAVYFFPWRLILTREHERPR
jgi:hypothetical protein